MLVIATKDAAQIQAQTFHHWASYKGFVSTSIDKFADRVMPIIKTATNVSNPIRAAGACSPDYAALLSLFFILTFAATIALAKAGGTEFPHRATWSLIVDFSPFGLRSIM